MGAKRWTGWLEKKSRWIWKRPFANSKRDARSRFPPLRVLLDFATFVTVVSVKAWSSKRLWDRWKTRWPSGKKSRR